MEEEKTLLQQIRQKEQEFAIKIEAVRAETDREVGAARSEAEALLCTADSQGKTEAERIYWEGKSAIEAETAALEKEAAAERGAAERSGEKNLSRAVDAITGYIIMD